jgi:acylphosphatase
MIARRFVIRGRVQGVGYRHSMVDAARALGLSGWVRNRGDGTVEALVQGEAASIDAIVAWCRRGPPAARVAGLVATEEAVDSSLERFGHRPTEC